MAAGATYEPIATTTLGSAASSIIFSSIPSTYTDLRLVLVAGGTPSASGACEIRFNSDTATNYSQTYITGTGSAASSSRFTSRSFIFLAVYDVLYTTPQLLTADIFGYAGSTYKTCLTTQNADLNGSGDVSATVGLWRSTAAINRIDLITDAGVSFTTGTTATLYGIKAA